MENVYPMKITVCWALLRRLFSLDFFATRTTYEFCKHCVNASVVTKNITQGSIELQFDEQLIINGYNGMLWETTNSMRASNYQSKCKLSNTRAKNIFDDFQL